MRSLQSSFEQVDPADPDGPLVTEGYVCASMGSRFELTKVTLPSLSPTMVQVDILMVGLCHTDILMRDNSWGTTDYPFVAGHEGVGRVTHVGSSVRSVSVGDRIAIGWIRDSCSVCDACISGRENVCREGYQGTYLGKSSGIWGKSPLKYNEHGGCFVRVQRVEERFAVKIPEGVPSHVASPLLCGGATMFEPLCDYGGAGVKMGIGSIGGLGTLGIKLARLMGCVVYALSGSPSKKERALAAGAHEFVDLGNPKDVEKVKGRLDVLIDTSPARAEVRKYLEFLTFNGTLVRVGAPPVEDQQMECDGLLLVTQQKKIAGSTVTGVRRMKEMLELVDMNMDFMKDDEEWSVEIIKMGELNEAMEKLHKRTNKGYRYVLEW